MQTSVFILWFILSNQQLDLIWNRPERRTIGHEMLIQLSSIFSTVNCSKNIVVNSCVNKRKISMLMLACRALSVDTHFGVRFVLFVFFYEMKWNGIFACNKGGCFLRFVKVVGQNAPCKYPDFIVHWIEHSLKIFFFSFCFEVFIKIYIDLFSFISFFIIILVLPWLHHTSFTHEPKDRLNCTDLSFN